MSRRCEIYECSRRPGSPCCADCDDKECPSRCLNGPERCRCCREDVPKSKPADAGEGPARYYRQGHEERRELQDAYFVPWEERYRRK